jgi:5-methylcytosine-specific restriction endonuclease McrA
MSTLNEKVLVLNRSYLPVHITSVRRAITLLYRDAARAVDEEYRVFDFAGWLGLDASAQFPSIGLTTGRIRTPRVVLLLCYDRMPKRSVRFSRYNVYVRDRHSCQYCGRRLARQQLNLDHVIPRSHGGSSTWDNVVCSCHRCNRMKGGRTPEAAGMPLLRRPFKPAWSPLLVEGFSANRYKEWLPFLSPIGGASWGAGGEAEEDSARRDGG